MEGDPVEKCMRDANLRVYVADAAFCQKLQAVKLQARAAKNPEQVSDVARMYKRRVLNHFQPFRGIS